MIFLVTFIVTVKSHAKYALLYNMQANFISKSKGNIEVHIIMHPALSWHGTKNLQPF